MDLSDLKPAPGSRSSRKRLGRGPGSGNGQMPEEDFNRTLMDKMM